MKTIKNNFLKAFLLLISGLLSTYTYAQEQNTDQGLKIKSDENVASCNSFCGCAGNTQAPLGVMTDHIHSKGEWMLTYTYMNTMMQGNNIGASKVSDNEVYKNYMMAPETMTMQMHMAMLMYGVTDRLTVMAMGGYMVNNMNMVMSSTMQNMPGMVMTPGNLNMPNMSSGLTDTRLSALYNFSKKGNQRIIGSLGINLPTGTIMATGATVLGDGNRLAYDMQTGTGSVGIAPDITYARKYSSFYWGANAGANINLNYNSLGYKCGNTYHATAWAGYQLLPFVSGTLRAESVHQDMISGADKVMVNPYYEESDPTTQTSNYGGTWMNMYVGLNFYIMKPVLEHFRILTEYGMPVYQNLNGTQMALKSNFLAALQYSF